MLLIIKEIDLSLRKVIYLTKLILLEIYNNNGLNIPFEAV